MPLGDYDLVVIGDGKKAGAIALKAAKIGARVALATSLRWDLDQLEQVVRRFQLCTHSLKSLDQLEQIDQILESLLFAQKEQIEFLQTCGVDVILGKVQFSDRRTIIIQSLTQVDQNHNPINRKLTSRRFVIVQDSILQRHRILGLDQISYLTYDSLFKLLPTGRLSSIAILAEDALGCAIAQILHKLGIKVRIITAGSILPEFDLDIARILQAHLEIQGIEIYTGTIVTAISDQKIWITTSLGTHALDRDGDILLPSSAHIPDLNLTAAGIQTYQGANQGEILITSKLQTTNPNIYLCHQLNDIDIILKNALFWKIFALKPSIPAQISYTQPQLASIGLSELAARLQYGKNVYVWQRYSQSDGGEFYKVLYRDNGEIVGAHFMEAYAQELLASVAIMIHKKIKVTDVANLPNGAIAELCQEISTEIWARNWKSLWFRLRS
ncbi:pyruvate/2-oxoglutarate dehydrogenase complex, dihydrolipoamide dehydrogenase component [Synechococcus sp. PCC 7502]|uniref:FAD-dependent oxidoreductase n=1 Tax=Synechococcus sp. PCC 7502 TaxID=1173263 RepID=UPI00029FF680|nr:FAD-dependent oxidoreductase [Synechococcus sp. PCC 7502]AFY74433.1 pyruvate/2-oxoglutarate dehydrogenase complex, dihydrolipoamide dehydrogenase component [Synechococcus sp. PCC 7502]